MIPARGYLVGLSISLTPLTDPDYRPFSRRIAWLAADASTGAIAGFTDTQLGYKPTGAVHRRTLDL